MSIVSRTLSIANSDGAAYHLIITTRSGSFEGTPLDFEDGVLRLEVWGPRADHTNGPTGNDLLIAESAVEMIEIDWDDTYGLCNGDDEAVVANATRRQAESGNSAQKAAGAPFGAERVRTYLGNVRRILDEHGDV
jgi:hypothetical protein